MAKNNFISSIWDFTQTTLDTLHPIHDYFRWYGKLPQLLVRRLIEMYSKEKTDTILANFAGSGTVLIEANLAKRKSIGVDSNPLSYLLCKVKLSNFIPDTSKFLERVKLRLNEKNRKLLFDVPEGDKWFYKDTLIDLETILDEIKKIENENEQNFYLLALANIIRDASKIDSRCVNHIVLDKNKSKINVLNAFLTSIKELETALVKFRKYYNNIQTDIYLGDARNLDFIKPNSVDLVIAHPPYFGAILYYNIYRLATDLLGFSNKEVKATDISTNSLNRYIKDMQKVFDEMHRVLKPKKHACVIIGDTRRDGDIIPMFSHFIDYATKNGFKLRDIFIWIMGGKAGMNIARRGNYIDHNYILVFQKITS